MPGGISARTFVVCVCVFSCLRSEGRASVESVGVVNCIFGKLLITLCF